MKVFQKLYPFSAIVGQEKLKKALILCAINPAVGGLLIRGEKGTAKSTAVRSLAAILPKIRVLEGCPFSCDPDNPSEWCSGCRQLKPPVPVVLKPIPVVTLPLNATEDRVVGSIDFERAIKTGERRFYPGVLARAHRGILYVDEINLLDDYIADLILDAAASGLNRVEREGISFVHPARFILVGTMNPEEGSIRPQLLDRFGVCVDVSGEKDLNRRVELMTLREEFDNDPESFNRRFEEDNRSLARKILAARELLSKVKTPDPIRKFISDLCLENNVAGHRADIVLEQAARALAAFKGRLNVTIEDVGEVAQMVLIHRRRESAPAPPAPAPRENQEHERPDQKAETRHQREPKEAVGEFDDAKSGRSPGKAESADGKQEQDESPEDHGAENEKVNHERIMERVFEIGETFRVRKISAPKDRLVRRGSGRRSRTRTAQRRGRYVRSSRLMSDGMDVALDATLRAAAPYQIHRRGQSIGELAVHLTLQDIRHKIREKRMGNFLLFVVDASGSMGAQGRMAATKGAIMSLLLDAYQKRDRVAMVCFRQKEAEVKLPPTSSVELAAKQLRELPVGGRTPLSAGLIKAHEVLRSVFLKDPSARPIVIVVTDGRANVSVGEGKKPLEEALFVARKFAADDRVLPVVVDTEKSGVFRFGLARRLADVMNASYFRIEDLKAEKLLEVIKEVSR
ncbi:putative cobaltochelatase [Thermodesulforhabdus norvegica]|uniref:Mg-protoporphyrin IX chelatase n=1 Tax=Thermodesulforhabdus norvegica TaxID=39841 RepID=A0A1I4RMU1_9BACT|nr:putative cobaltochelatase [Thermodesulforhabdus norvegica]SFM53575.1 protoporphyrin IX magnesium-chelatase [Thermodesulforhabdus norvegica]